MVNRFEIVTVLMNMLSLLRTSYNGELHAVPAVSKPVRPLRIQ